MFLYIAKWSPQYVQLTTITITVTKLFIFILWWEPSVYFKGCRRETKNKDKEFHCLSQIELKKKIWQIPFNLFCSLSCPLTLQTLSASPGFMNPVLASVWSLLTAPDPPPPKSTPAAQSQIATALFTVAPDSKASRIKFFQLILEPLTYSNSSLTSNSYLPETLTQRNPCSNSLLR